MEHMHAITPQVLFADERGRESDADFPRKSEIAVIVREDIVVNERDDF